MVPPVDWDARPRAWLMYLEHLKDTDETAHQALIAKLDAGDIADVKWAASAQRTGDQDEADDTDSVAFSDTDEELQWQDPKAFFRSWTNANAKEHRAKIRKQRTEIEAREKELATVHELAADPAVPDQTTTTTNSLEPPVPSPPTTQPGRRASPAGIWSTSPVTGPAADVQAIKDIGRRRYTEQSKREETEEEEMMDRLGRLRTG